MRWGNTIYLESKSYERPLKDSIKNIKRDLEFLERMLPKQTSNEKKIAIQKAIEKKKLLIKEFESASHKSHKCLKRKIKKRSNIWIKKEVLKIIHEKNSKKTKTYKDTILTKENVARILQVKESQVQQVFMELNREGVLYQPIHHAPHDSQRDPWGFKGCMGWAEDIYEIRNKNI